MTRLEFLEYERKHNEEMRIIKIKRESIENRMRQADTDEAFEVLAEQHRQITDKIKDMAEEYHCINAMQIYEESQVKTG